MSGVTFIVFEEATFMTKGMLVLVVVLVTTIAMAQIQAPTSDVLGAHLNYGRGCAACHAPHGGAYGNGAAKVAQTATLPYLWGQDTTSLLGQTITLSGGFVETLPSALSAATPDVSGILTCLSCHDGNLAKGAMMKNMIYESLPATYGTFNTIPTLLGNTGALGVGNYTSTHPVGLNAVVGCGGTGQWDCTNNNGVITMNGPNSSKFVVDYGFFVQLAPYNSTATVMCTTCHNPHSMNAVGVTNGPTSGLPSGVYATMFFILAPYNPASTTAGSNQTTQFCRQCHGAESNEMIGGVALPTIF
jgi:cytochrome c553